MKKFLKKNWRGFLGDVRGTALLVALLVMGVLIAVSLILSSLILRETRVVKDLIDAGKAYYAAESGIEIALYELNNNLPGWEPVVSDNGYKSFELSQNDSKGEFKVANRCSAYPCFDEDFDVSEEFGPVPSPKEFYGILDLNESITIPLFVAKDEGTRVSNVGNFVVEFFAPFNPNTDTNFDNPEDLSGWDVLRWKVFGIRKDESGAGAGITESISDFTALSMLNNAEGDPEFSTNAMLPSWFGTMSCNEGLTDDQAGARYNQDIECRRYILNNLVEVDPASYGQVSKIFAGSCSQSEAREYYLYEYEGGVRKVESENIYGCYPIKQFLDAHKLNYLSLTNLVNPAVFNVGATGRKDALSKLYFRVELFDDGDTVSDEGVASGNETVREFAEITANGYSGNNSKQSIDVRIKRDSFMPVFHFSLYSTYMNDNAGHDEEYWYGPEEGDEELLL